VSAVGAVVADAEAGVAGDRLARLRPGDASTAVLACIALAGLSVLVLPSVPSYDPWAWIVWGRELTHGVFATNGGSSWKPLPVAFTTVFGLFGGAAPKLWLVAARAGGLLALVAAYRLAARLAGGLAGAIAVVTLALTQEKVGTITQDWVHYLFRGASEPMLVACALWAIDRHLHGRRATALILAAATGLIRPEAWPFLGLYAIWLWRDEPRLRLLVAGCLLVQPLLWFGPPGISTGHPFSASSQAIDYNGQLGSDPFVTVIHRGVDLSMTTVLIGALIAVALAWRQRDRLALWLTGGAVGWAAVVVAMTVIGYPGLGRFMYPAAALECVLAGVGVVRLARLARDSDVGAAVFGLPPAARYWTVIALAAVVSIPFAHGRVSLAWGEKGQADLAVKYDSELSNALKAAGGTARVLPCPTSVVAINHTMQTAFAWKLDVRLSRVKTVLDAPGVDFVAPHDATIDGAAAPITFGHVHQLVTTSGLWQIYRIVPPGGVSPPCVGG
jgi:hypothetical protein